MDSLVKAREQEMEPILTRVFDWRDDEVRDWFSKLESINSKRPELIPFLRHHDAADLLVRLVYDQIFRVGKNPRAQPYANVLAELRRILYPLVLLLYNDPNAEISHQKLAIRKLLHDSGLSVDQIRPKTET